MNPLLFPPSRLARSVLRADSDERLAELARAGSDAAFEAIVARHRGALVRHCSRIVGDSDAEEAVQNALISAHLALARGDRVQNLGAWLRAISHNASLNILRARAARPESPDRGHPATAADHDPAHRREQLGELVEAVQSLPQRQRHAIVMRELEGRSYDEIAVRLGATNGAVRQLLNRARAGVRDRLAILPGLAPAARWLADGGAGAASVRLGALAGGCTATAKLCAAALLPAVIATGPATPTLVPARPKAARHATSVRQSVKLAARRTPTPAPVRAAPSPNLTGSRSAIRPQSRSDAPRRSVAKGANAPRTSGPAKPRQPERHAVKPPAPTPLPPQHQADWRQPTAPQPSDPPQQTQPDERPPTPHH